MKKKSHVEVARLQDELVSLAYALDNTCVLHGGTAIWRCYGAKRFSEDIDLYASSPGKWTKTGEAVSRRGLTAIKLKTTDNLLFAKVRDENAEVRLEVNLSQKNKGILADYEKADGSYIQVLALPPEGLFLEKIAAYSDRRFVRDLYDLVHLGPIVNEGAVLHAARKFAAGIPAPVDEENLKTIVYEGNIPDFEQLCASFERRWK